MILIADSGSTKTDWRLIDEGKITSIATAGFNPYFQTTKQISDELQTALVPYLPANFINSASSIYFYGAGCSSPDKILTVTEAIVTNFPNAIVEVDHDLLAAARALCGTESGIAAILGTGSNSCFFDGAFIKTHVPSLGFILGDEGSGAHLGKKLVSGIIYGEFSKDLEESFFSETNEQRLSILESVYNKPLPNRYLASFARFIYNHRENAQIKELVKESFNEFFIHHINKYKGLSDKFNCVGSVGFLFQDILKEVAASHVFQTGVIIKSPIDGLVKFHNTI